MRSVSTINTPKLSVIFFLILGSFQASAQENSPFSRYGLGDPYPSQNVINRGMGGVASTYGNWQSINLSNPASYSELKVVTYDIGVAMDSRTLRSANPIQKYNSVNLTPSYVSLGMPISKKHNLGLAFGLRSLARISYSIEERKRLRVDSMQYLYEGDGGLYQAFVGVGKSWGGLHIGINTGYMFGRKENTTRAIPIDSVLTYKSNSSTLTTYGSAFINAGLQYEAKFSKKTSMRFGFSGNLKQSLSAQQQINRETFSYDPNGLSTKIDSVYQTAEESGTIELPVSYTAGVSLNSYVVDNLGGRYDKGLIALEYESTQWSNYRFFKQPDKLINSWQLKLGGQFVPNPIGFTKSYWNRVTYRAGVYMGKEAANADGNELPVVGLTLGAGFPVRKWIRSDDQFTTINTTVEIGKRGNKKNNITESFFRVSFGLNLSDVWFKKRRYD
ncbi:MAG: hypothetical protein JWQ40_690 [Segetibacter sp.]|nr:hypothetical protein [Segetibacter sp.]